MVYKVSFKYLPLCISQSNYKMLESEASDSQVTDTVLQK